MNSLFEYQTRMLSFRLIKKGALLLLFLPLLLCAFVPRLSAQQASVSTTRTTRETPLTLSVTLDGGDGEVDTSGIEDFEILSQGSSSRVQYINGKVSSSQTKTYSLLPLREGTLTIPALPVTVDGKTSYTIPITVEVSKSATATGTSGQNVQVVGKVDEPTPYLGQQLVYTFQLLYEDAVQLANADYEPPPFDGFSATQIGETKNSTRVIDGKSYHEVSLSYLLVPIKTGTLTIEPARLQCDLVVTTSQSRQSPLDSFFDDPFFRRSQLVTRIFRTDPITIDVSPLPAWSGVEPFTGLIGQFDITAAVENEDVTVGESTTLSVTLRGSGNLQDAETPALQIPEAFKKYADQPDSSISLDEAGYSGSKTFKTALVPVRPGDYTLSVTPMVYFDPERETYRNLSAESIAMHVKAATTPAETPTVFSSMDADGGTATVRKQKVGVTGRDILSVKTELDALQPQKSLPLTWFLFLLLIPGVLFTAATCFRKISRKDESPGAEMARKSREALKAGADARGKDAGDLLSNLYRALLYAVFSRAGMLGESLTTSEVASLLEKSAVSAKTADAVGSLLGRLESARFGKATLSREEQGTLVTQTRKLVGDLIR